MSSGENPDGKCDQCSELIEQIRETSNSYHKVKSETAVVENDTENNSCNGDNILMDHDIESKFEPDVKLELKVTTPSILKKAKGKVRKKAKLEQVLLPHEQSQVTSYFCPDEECRQRFVYHARLVEHALKLHDIVVPPLAAAQREQECCPFCQEKFSSKNSFLVSHVRAMHCAERESPTYIEFMRRHTKTRVCQVCGQTFNTRQAGHILQLYLTSTSKVLRNCERFKLANI